MAGDGVPGESPAGVSFLATAWLLWFLAHATRNLLGPVLPLIEDELLLTHAQAGRIFTFLTVGYCTALFSVPFWSRTPGYRRTLHASLAGLTLALFFLFWTPGLAGICALAALLGLATGTILPSAIPMITAVYGRERWGRSLGLFNSAAPAGQFVSPVIVVVILAVLPWRYVFWVMAALSLAVFLLFLRTAPRRDPPADRPRGSVLAVVRNPSIVILGCLWVLASSSGAGLGFLLPVYLVKERGMDLAWANGVFALGRGAAVFATLYVGALTDRMPCRNLLGWTMVLTGVSEIGIAYWPGVAGTAVWVFVQALANLLFFPVGLILLSRLSTEGARGTAVGLVIGLGAGIGFGVTPWALGAVADAWSFRAGIAALGAAVLLASLSVLRLERR